MILIIAISTFVCISLGMLGVYWLLYKPQSAATERLRRLGGKEGGIATATVPGAAVIADDSPATDLAQRLANPLNKLLPPLATEARKTQRLLMQAGYRSPEASIIYRGIHVASMVGIPVITALVTTYFAKAFSTVIIAMMKVSSELSDVHQAVAYEFEIANLEIRVGRERDEALRNLAERTGVDDLKSLVAMLIQADRFGTSIAKAVRVYADSLRTKRRQRAEQAAQKAAVKLLMPLALFLFPTLFIVILGPAGLNLMDTMGTM